MWYVCVVMGFFSIIKKVCLVLFVCVFCFLFCVCVVCDVELLS